MDPYITAGVVAFAILLGYAGMVWFLYMDNARMEREEQELEVPKKAVVVAFRRPA